MGILAKLKQLCWQTVSNLYPELRETHNSDIIEVTPATKPQFGHYQCNSAMKLTKILKTAPRQIAENITQALLEENNSQQTPLFAKIEIAGPGFINITLSNEFIAEQLNHQLRDERLGVPLPEQPKKVVIDFSSPNTAKEMHVGHLRSTIIGDALARVLSFIGHDVLRLNHIGDRGTQFGMIIQYIKEHQPQVYKGHFENVSLSDLVNWYRQSKVQFDEDQDFKKRSQLAVVALQENDADTVRVWEMLCEISRQAYQEIYDLLDIDIVERGESFYHPWLDQTVEKVKAKDLLTESDGAQCVYLDGFTNRSGEPLPLIVQKADGGYNYATTDLAALDHRVNTEKGDWLIYVTDAGQAQHFDMVFKAGALAGIYQPKEVRIDHVPFGLVLRPDGKKFKTRSGDTERLIDLLVTAIDKATAIIKERLPDVSDEESKRLGTILGLDGIKYADLSCHRTSDYTFSYERMLNFEGNTAAFLLYAYVRIQSIQRKIGIPISDIINTDKIIMTEPAEISLGLQLIQFNDILNATAKELMPHRLTEYLYQLAEKFHAFFHQCRVEGSQQQNARLLLCDLTAQVLACGLNCLGLKTIDKM